MTVAPRLPAAAPARVSVHAARASRILLLAAACALSACTTAYGPAGATGSGYSESWHGDDRVVVTFEGNVTTRQAEAEDLALLRAAELSLQRGYPWFVVRRQAEADTEMHVHVQRDFGPSGYVFPYSGFGTDAGNTGAGSVYKRGARLYVVLLKQKPEGQVTGLRDAAEVRADLSRLYDTSTQPSK